MRKFLITLLLASALTPAAAYAQDRDRGDRAERTSEDRPQRAERAERSERPQRAERAERPERPQRAERAAAVERPQRAERTERAARVDRPDKAVQIERVRPVRTERADRPVRVDRNVRQVETTQPTQPVQTQRSGSGLIDGFRSIAREQQAERSGDNDGWRRDRDGDGRRWSGDWRRDHRYDWRGHRSRYSQLYRLGRYYDPYRYGYRRFSIGFSLWPSYYGSNFWLNDPWQYRLPPAYGPYRWVRYYDDALLVNIYTGQVADVIYGFFW